MKYVILIVTLLLCFCDVLTNNDILLNNVILINNNSQLSECNFIGLWVFKEFINHKNIYEKSDEFDHNKPGIEFKSDYSLIKRQNIGWCGTPPITYGNYNGMWKFVEKNTLQIIYEYWGGLDTSEIVLDSVSNDLLILKWK